MENGKIERNLILILGRLNAKCRFINATDRQPLPEVGR